MFRSNVVLAVALVLSIGSTTALTGCVDDSVPVVEDPANPVVQGQKMTTAGFLKSYCAGKAENPTCVKVWQAKNQEHKPLPGVNGW